MTGAHNPVVTVAAGIVRNPAGDILLAQRPAGKVMAGRWEFPGGKLEPGETREAALVRELHEELGIVVEHTRPLIRLRHHYPALSVALAVREVERYRGTPRARENQTLAWAGVNALAGWDLLAADGPIVAALQLPDYCWVTPTPEEDMDAWLATARATIAAGVPMLVCRLPRVSDADRMTLGRIVRNACRERQTRFIWNGTARQAAALDADGLHLSAARLRECKTRPTSIRWVGASCHCDDEVEHAHWLGLDYIFIGSVHPTPSHPDGVSLGLAGFERLANRSNLPAYAIGGMKRGDIDRVRAAGGQGIAAIRALAA